MHYIYAIGDIHGEYEHLIRLWGKIWRRIDNSPSYATHEFVFLGDYVDRGLKSKEVIDFLLELKSSSCKTTMLLGNHDDMLLSHIFGKLDDDAIQAWNRHGFQETLDSFGDSLKQVKYRDFLLSLPYTYETENHKFVHASFCPDGSVNPTIALWYHVAMTHMDRDYGKYAVQGHIAKKSHVIGENTCLIDTGCGKGGYLTCAVFNNDVRKPIAFVDSREETPLQRDFL